MTCAEIQSELSLYLYGELDFASEELVEVHLIECAFCQLALHREKQWHAAVNRQQQDVSPEWLADCRRGLLEQVGKEPATSAHVRHRIAGWVRSTLDIRVNDRSYRLAAVSFLLLAGFGAGRVYHPPQFEPRSLLNTAGLTQPAVTQVREIHPEEGNRVLIVLQQEQVREISGSRNDDSVREILLGAARDALDPGVRLDSVEMLAGQDNLAIQDVLVNSIKSDPNAAVRAKAIDALRQFRSNATIRSALEYALRHDSDAGVRAEAIDVLIPVQGNVQVTPQLIEEMSDLLQSQQGDDYVRLRCAQVLNHKLTANDIY